MTTWWWRAKGGGGAGSGTLGDPFNGAKTLDGKINDGTIAAGDTIEFHHSHGPVTVATDSADWPSTASASTALASGSKGGPTTTGASRYTNVQGIIFGTSYGADSTASGRIFSFANATGGGYAFDMRGTTLATRMFAALRAKGEGIVIRGLKVYTPDWGYICDDSVDPPVTRIAPVSGLQAEQVSSENGGIYLFGNGNTLEDWEVDGGQKWCRYGVLFLVSAELVTTATGGLHGYLQDGVAIGCLTGLEVQPHGSGTNPYHLEKPTFVTVRRNIIRDPGWGRSTLHLPTGSGNSAAHGNGIGVQGRFFGGCLVYLNEVYGDVQDAFAVGSAAGAMVFLNYSHDIGQTSYSEWYSPSAGVWDTRTVTGSAEGNHFKLGLASRDGTGPSTWLGSDGTAATAGSSLQVDEMRNVCAHNVGRNANGAGIVGNSGRGLTIHANEIYDARGPCLNLFVSNTARGTYWVTHNFFRKTEGDGTGGSSNFAGLIQANCHVHLYNNIFWSNPSISSNRDLRWNSATLLGKDKNVMVTNRADGTGYDSTGDMDATARTAAQSYVLTTVSANPVSFSGGGLPPGNALRGAGIAKHAAGRSFGTKHDLLGALLDTSAPDVGPIDS